MALTIEQIQSLDRAGLNRMTSDAYKENFDIATNPNAEQFRARIEAIENGPRQATQPAAGTRPANARPATPGETAFDPSWDDAPAPAAAAPAPAAQPAAPAPGNLAVWRYQPVDGQGRKVGGEQVFKYDPSLPNEHPQSLASQLTKAHSHATSALKARKTQEFIESVTPVAEYKEPALLTIDQHPDAEALNAMTQSAINNGVMSALNLFKQSHPEFVLGEANAVAMCKWVEKSGRNPVDGQTWELAWKSLKPYLLADEVPAAAAPAPTPAPAPKAAASAVPPSNAGRVGTGLSNADAFNNEDNFEVAPVKVQGQVFVMPDGKKQVLTVLDLNRMGTDVMKRLLRSPANAQSANALYAAEDQRKAAARSGR